MSTHNFSDGFSNIFPENIDYIIDRTGYNGLPFDPQDFIEETHACRM
jgi:hypothetical protein